ncbi:MULTISPECIES: acetyl-CoA C-acetyltransferase [Hydrocarboniphaga]|jgi:acetyl-CoA C-acetyltransferase|uniref:Acetyl-CoA acetyltransferase n=1 Tax=Hydrocarboniphaga effusa AP103 TaxID=1172194 RepID=I8I670_9GAMM|nr:MULTISPECIES: acetyl-CoA C-acetyltransferase [Hydrocarboniphaga]EIT72176.1 acetyl-CoA acetyltransferase [Hydrocarboniphaga effusa AP103]MDZ4079687.1 acetyl-CoA C-acetyltransferase [Hydrocarboniphaga sp.]
MTIAKPPIGRRVALLGGSRIPFCRSNTTYSNKSNQDMLTATLRGVVDKFQLQGERLGEVAAGAVLKHSRDFNLTRECVLSSGLAAETPAYDVQQACGTGLEAAILVGNKIALGQIESGIAGGVDTASDAPIAVGEKLRKILLELNRAKTGGQRLAALAKFRPSMLAPAIPSNGEPRTRKSMGEHCELMAQEWNIAREDQDQLAFESHRKAAAAYDAGFYDDLIIEYAGIKRDNNLRADSTLEKLATLKPVFDRKSGRGTLTAGNSTPLSDGASAVLLASEEWAAAHGFKPQAFITHAETAAVDFVVKKEGLLMAPAYAVPRMLARAGLTLQDFDFYEIHEAFAAQVLCTLKAWEDPKFCKERLGLDKPLGSIDRSKMNVKGGSVALAHPFAATGGRILATLGKALEERGSGRGLISICAAGGLGVTAIVER